MKFLIVLTLFGYSLAELNSYDDFKAYSVINNKSVADYAVELGFKSFDHEFNKFKIEFNRKYESPEEEERRKFNFLKTLQFVEKHNKLYKKGGVTHEAGISHFADLTAQEYAQTFSMPSPLKINVSIVQNNVEEAIDFAALPESFDWRERGKVTPVKNQGVCGSCWAFTTIALVESGYLIHHNQQLSLSEQQLVDCLNTNCGPFYLDKGLAYVQANGVEKEAEYPYQDKALACRNIPSRFHARISGYRNMGRAAGHNPASDAEIMSAIMNNGPVGFLIDVGGDDFAHYKGGVLTTGINQWVYVHIMTLVGWGTHNSTPYWLIKNSWGTGWGEAGYLKMARNRNIRGINEWLYYPTF